MKNWIKAFLIAVLTLSLICFLVTFAPIVVFGFVIIVLIVVLTCMVKMILDDY